MMRRQKSRGFTLIEALAAIAVMVIVMPILLQGFAMANGIAGNIRQTADATALAQSAMDEMLATRSYSVSGQEVVNGTTYTITSVSADYDGEADVSQLAVQVVWNSRGQEHEVTLTTLYFTPTDTTGGTTPLGGPLNGGGQP